MRSFTFCQLSVLCGLMLGIWLLWSGGATSAADTAPAGAVEEGEPNAALGVLEFRIAPHKPGSGPGPSPLTQAEIARCRQDLAANGPMAARSRNDSFVWIKFHEALGFSENLIVEEYRTAMYLLVHNREPFVMRPGEDWGLRYAAKGTAHNRGRPYIQYQFDQDGADSYYDLTSANIGKVLAVIIEGQVVMVPAIRGAGGGQSRISGNFTRGHIDEMVEALQKVVLPAVRAASAPKTVPPPTRRSARTYLIPVLILVLVVSIVGFLVYR